MSYWTMVDDGRVHESRYKLLCGRIDDGVQDRTWSIIDASMHIAMTRPHMDASMAAII